MAIRHEHRPDLWRCTKNGKFPHPKTRKKLRPGFFFLPPTPMGGGGASKVDLRCQPPLVHCQFTHKIATSFWQTRAVIERDARSRSENDPDQKLGDLFLPLPYAIRKQVSGLICQYASRLLVPRHARTSVHVAG